MIEVFVVIDGELVVHVFDAIVFNLLVKAYAQRVVAREVGGLAHQKQSIFSRFQQRFCLFPLYSSMEPAKIGGQRKEHRLGKGKSLHATIWKVLTA